MKKRQWRMLMTEILATRNEASNYHVCLTSQLQVLSDRLDAIERRLPPEPGALGWRPHEPGESYADLRTYEIMPDGTRRECEE